MIRRPPRSTLFPYPTLSRSLRDHRRRPVDVQRRRLADHSGLEDTAGPLRRGGLGGDDDEGEGEQRDESAHGDRKSTRLNSSHGYISYAVFCLKKKKKKRQEC